MGAVRARTSDVRGCPRRSSNIMAGHEEAKGGPEQMSAHNAISSQESAPLPAMGSGSLGRPSAAIHVCLATAAALLWIVSLPAITLSEISGWGLLPALPISWWLAALVVVPFVIAVLQGNLGNWILWYYQSVLVAIFFATTSVAYEWPRYPWTFKHVGVVEHILATGQVDRTIDIYNNWPGFFVLAALFSKVLQINPLTVAQWAEPFFAMVATVSVMYAVSALSEDRRVIWIAAVLFTLGNWIGSNYYSPQALATVLASLFLGFILRVFPVRNLDGALRLRTVMVPLLRNRFVTAAMPSDSSLLPTSRPVVMAVATVLWAALVVTHQLTPVAVMFQLIVLACFVQIRPLWLLVVWAVMEAAWIALALPFLVERYALFQSGALFSLAWPGATRVPSLPGMRIVGFAAPLLVIGLPMVALASAAWRLAKGYLELVAVILAFAPFLILGVQTYGGEAIFRVYLYGLPWYGYLIALAAVRTWDKGGLRRQIILVCTIALGVLAVTASFGQELINRVQSEDVKASQWFETSTPAKSYALAVTGPGFPLLLTADYPSHQRQADLADQERIDPGSLGSDRILALAVNTFESRGPGGYFVLTEKQYVYGKMYGLATSAQLAELINTVEKRPDFTVVYRSGDVIIARYIGNTAR